MNAEEKKKSMMSSQFLAQDIGLIVILCYYMRMWMLAEIACNYLCGILVFKVANS